MQTSAARKLNGSEPGIHPEPHRRPQRGADWEQPAAVERSGQSGSQPPRGPEYRETDLEAFERQLREAREAKLYSATDVSRILHEDRRNRRPMDHGNPGSSVRDEGRKPGGPPFSQWFAVIWHKGAPIALAFGLGLLIATMLYQRPVMPGTLYGDSLPEIWRSVRP